MDARFRPAMQAAWGGDADGFLSLLDADVGLVTARSSRSHPTLLQFVVLEGHGGKIDGADRFARALIERGADLEEPLVAAASVGSRPMTDLLLGAGAPIEAGAPWTPLEESVYWAHRELSEHLLAQGARIPSLRAAAGLGRGELVSALLAGLARNEEGEAVRFPWGTFSTGPTDVLDQALVIAAKNGHGGVVRQLVGAGARVDVVPPGVHEGGSALHLAALHGRGEVVRALLELGADAGRADSRYGSDAAAWAEHGGHPALAAELRRSA